MPPADPSIGGSLWVWLPPSCPIGSTLAEIWPSRTEPFGEKPRRAGDVAEQHRHRLSLLADRRGDGDGRGTKGAERELARSLLSAGRAGLHSRPSLDRETLEEEKPLQELLRWAYELDDMAVITDPMHQRSGRIATRDEEAE